jgi:hypothetical protein
MIKYIIMLMKKSIKIIAHTCKLFEGNVTWEFCAKLTLKIADIPGL